MKNLKITILFSLISLFADAKFYLPSREEIVELEKRILLVELKEVDEDVLWSFNNETQKQEYQAHIANYNVFIQGLFEKNWTWSKQEIKFIPTSQLEEITDKSLVNFAVFNSTQEVRSVVDQGTYSLTKFNLFYMANNGLITTVLDIAFNTNNYVTKGEIGLAVKSTNLHLKAAKEGIDSYKEFLDVNRNIEVLKSKVLFVDENFNKVEPGLIGNKYKNGFKVVKSSHISELLDEEKIVAAVTKVTYNKKENRFYCTVFDAANGRILAIADFKGNISKKELENSDATANITPGYAATNLPENPTPAFKFIDKKLYGKFIDKKAQIAFCK